MKKITFGVVTFLSLILIGAKAEALTIKGPSPYFPKIDFIERTLPNGITITEILNNENYSYKVNNSTDKTLFFFAKSSYSKEDISKNLSKINDKLPRCSSEIETKTEIGCLNLMDGSNLSSFNTVSPFGDGRVIFDNEEKALASLREQVQYPNTPKPIPISIYGLYDNKLIHIQGTINYELNEKYPDYNNSQPVKQTFISKIINWFRALFN